MFSPNILKSFSVKPYMPEPDDQPSGSPYSSLIKRDGSHIKRAFASNNTSTPSSVQLTGRSNVPVGEDPKVEKEKPTTVDQEGEKGEVTNNELEALKHELQARTSELEAIRGELKASLSTQAGLRASHHVKDKQIENFKERNNSLHTNLIQSQTTLSFVKRDLNTAQNNIGFRDLLMGSAVTGYAVVANWSGMVSAFTAGASYIAGTVPGQYIGAAASIVSAKTAAATSWLASTKIAVAVPSEVVKGVLGGSKVSVLGTVSAVYGAVFTIAVNFLSMPIDIVLEKSKYLKKRRFTRQVVSHALAGATLYGVSAGIAKMGVTAAAISAPGAAILTVAALATYLFIEKIHFSKKTSN